jgi:opacity protein-like surface antigen
MRKSLLVLCALLLFSAALFAQYDEKKIEFSILGGYGLGSLKGLSNYADTWDYFLIDQFNESTAINLANKNTFTLGANFSYFFTPNIGIQLGGAFFSPKADVTSDWHFDWHAITSQHDTQDGSFSMTEAKMTSIPLYLNLIGRYDTGSFSIFGSAGPTIYFNKFNADASSIWGDTYTWWVFQWLDYFQIPVQIPETSWTGFGFNAGAGFDIKFSPSVAFTVEGRYFYCQSKELFWTWVPGTYSGLPYTYNGGAAGLFNNWVFTDAGLNGAGGPASKTTSLIIKPSFFSISGGFKFFF